MSTPAVVVTAEAVEVAGRRYSLKDIQGAAAEHRAPSLLWPAAIGGVCGVIVMPALLALLGSAQDAPSENGLYLGLFGAAILLFGSIGRLLFAEDRYCLMLELPDGPTCAFASDDAQLVISLVARSDEVRGVQRRIRAA